MLLRLRGLRVQVVSVSIESFFFTKNIICSAYIIHVWISQHIIDLVLQQNNKIIFLSVTNKILIRRYGQNNTLINNPFVTQWCITLA